MSTKPATLPRWSTDLSNATAPSEGQKDTGWTVGQDGVSDYDNWVKYWTYKWIEWLDGNPDMNIENLVVTGSTSYTSATAYALSGHIASADPLGTGALANVKTINVTPTNNWTLSGLVPGADGQEIEIVNVSTTQTFRLTNEESTTTASNRFSFPKALTPSAGDFVRVDAGGSVRMRYSATSSLWKVLSTNGCRILKYLTIPATMAVPQSGGSAETYGLHSASPGSGGYWDVDGYSTFDYPAPLPSNSIVDNYTVYVRKNSDGTHTLGATLMKRSGTDGTVTSSTGYTIGAAAPGNIPLFEGGLETAVSPTTAIYITVQRNVSGGTSDILYHALVGYWDIV